MPLEGIASDQCKVREVIDMGMHLEAPVTTTTGFLAMGVNINLDSYETGKRPSTGVVVRARKWEWCEARKGTEGTLFTAVWDERIVICPQTSARPASTTPENLVRVSLLSIPLLPLL